MEYTEISVLDAGPLSHCDAGLGNLFQRLFFGSSCRFSRSHRCDSLRSSQLVRYLFSFLANSRN